MIRERSRHLHYAATERRRRAAVTWLLTAWRRRAGRTIRPRGGRLNEGVVAGSENPGGKNCFEDYNGCLPLPSAR